jgi:hypothetical protein
VTSNMKKGMSARLALACLALAASLGLSGCPNPNAIGVQQFGIVKVLCVQATNNQPVAGANVSIAGVAAPSDATGTATLTQVPIGTHPVEAHAPGLDGQPQSVTVVQDQTINVTVLMSSQ